jgi:hypothetical protein
MQKFCENLTENKIGHRKMTELSFFMASQNVVAKVLRKQVFQANITKSAKKLN